MQLVRVSVWSHRPVGECGGLGRTEGDVEFKVSHVPVCGLKNVLVWYWRQ
ncbi:hypothetical protein [Glutamicibacter arilaitensis]